MNINEIAKLAGVSRATVSRYLNQGYVSAEKKEMIRKVIEETGYQPSTQAQMLRTKKTNIIGVILPKINSDSISRMVAGISMVLSKNGFQLLLANTENNIKQELKYLKVFKDNHVDGIILIGTIFTKEHKKILQEIQVPIVILGQKFEGYSCVYHDDYSAAKELTKSLLKTGACLGYIGVTEKDKAAGAERKKGYIDAHREKKVLKECMMESDFTSQSGYEACRKLLNENPKIDSLFCATDRIAIGAICYLKELGKNIPSQIQIVGIGDTEMGKVIEPKLTTVHFYYKTSGIEAANMLIEMINSGNNMRKEVKMGYQLIEQETTK